MVSQEVNCGVVGLVEQGRRYPSGLRGGLSGLVIRGRESGVSEGRATSERRGEVYDGRRPISDRIRSGRPMADRVSQQPECVKLQMRDARALKHRHEALSSAGPPRHQASWDEQTLQAPPKPRKSSEEENPTQDSGRLALGQQ